MYVPARFLHILAIALHSLFFFLFAIKVGLIPGVCILVELEICYGRQTRVAVDWKGEQTSDAG